MADTIDPKLAAQQAKEETLNRMENDNPYTNSPSGYEIASKMTDNPYLGTAIATGVDALLPLQGVMGSVKGMKGMGHPPEVIKSVADEYAKSKGLNITHDQPKVTVDPNAAAQVAKSFEEMKHDPTNPAVKKAYDALIKETGDQFKAIQKAGLVTESIKPNEGNPYKNSKELHADIHENGKIKYFPTEQGFGSQSTINDHPLLQETEFKDSEGRPLLANDVFRIVHDYFGHAKEAHSFGPNGEENAWQTHMPMYSPEAQKALTTETKGQNSWVNFGPHGEANRANPANTIYADQKAGILPDFTKKVSVKMPIQKDEKYAEGGSVQPVNFDSMVDDTQADDSMSPRFAPKQAMGFDDMVDDEEKYGTLGQQAITGAEALGRGLAGPLATGAEKLLGVKEQDILGRQHANPLTNIAGEATGLGLGFMTGTGEAGLMMKAGEVATEAMGVANLAKDAQLLHKVGSAAVQQAAEMAILQAGDETSKMLLHDPETSAESAIANIGMAAALGGAGGALVSGVVSPLWSATAGPKLDSLLNTVKDHLNGTAMLLPEQTENAIRNLGIEVAPEIRAGLSSNKFAVDQFNVAKELQNKEILEGLQKMEKDASNSVMRSLGIDPAEAEVYSTAEQGKKTLEAWKQEFKEKYSPIAEALDKRDAEAVNLPISDDSRLKTYGNLLEKGLHDVGTDSPYYEIYNKYGNRLLAKDTVGQLDKLKTEITNEMQAAKRAGQYNQFNAFRDVKSAISDLQESEIESLASSSEKLGIKGAGKEGQTLIAERQAANQAYRDFKKLGDDLTSHLGVGEFRGYKTLVDKLSEGLSAEEVAKKFSVKGDADFIKFLQKHFPETLEQVKKNELISMIKPAIQSAKGENEINIKKLVGIINKNLAGQKELVESIIPKESLGKIASAGLLDEAIPRPKSSGTAGWMTKVFSKMPHGAMSGLSMLMGHNPLFGYVLGETSQFLGRHMPDAARMGYLKFIGSDKPIKAEGFKAMVDFIHSTYKGQGAINKAISNVFEPGTKVLTAAMMPAKADLQKLDKLILKFQDAPNQLVAQQSDSHVGHYLPDHQAGVAQVSTRAVQYLQSLKPHAHQTSALGAEVQPTKQEIARYERALEIAQQPTIILQHVKDGTLKHSDIQDLGAMYPGLYKSMASKLTNEMINTKSDKTRIPYKTRIGVSLFLDTPVDNTMTPTAIQAAQATYAPKQPQQPQGAPKQKKANSSLGKTNKSYMTPNQASEAHRNEKE